MSFPYIRLRRASVLAIFVVLVSTSSQAQSINLNPGLWEYTNELTFVEGSEPRVQVFENCVTAEDLENSGFMMQDIDACEVVEQEILFDRMTYVMNCLGPEGTTLAIDARIEFDGDRATGVINNSVQTPLGEMDMVVNLSAERLGDCDPEDPISDEAPTVDEPAPSDG